MVLRWAWVLILTVARFGEIAISAAGSVKLHVWDCVAFPRAPIRER